MLFFKHNNREGTERNQRQEGTEPGRSGSGCLHRDGRSGNGRGRSRCRRNNGNRGTGSYRWYCCGHSGTLCRGQEGRRCLYSAPRCRCYCCGNIHRDQRVLFLIKEGVLLAYCLTRYSIVIIHIVYIALGPDGIRSRNVLGVPGVPDSKELYSPLVKSRGFQEIAESPSCREVRSKYLLQEIGHR